MMRFMIVLCLWAAPTVCTAQNTKLFVRDRAGNVPEPIVAIDGVCAWPNLTRLPNGDIVALIYNQPSHGQMPGDVDCWASTDEGETWTLRSVAAPRGTPQQNRMNIAAGLTAEGDLILVTSGWSQPGSDAAVGLKNIGVVLPAWVCISKDSGKTWTIDKESFPKAADGRNLIPFGDIMPGKDGRLRVAAYRGPPSAADETVPPLSADDAMAMEAADGHNWVVIGDGKTWDAPIPIGTQKPMANLLNETALLHLGDGKWVAAARYASGNTFIHLSDDDGKTWQMRRRVRGLPAHLLKLPDGTLVLTNGKRGPTDRGVQAYFSDNSGKTWSDSYRLADIEETDLGYPSSILRKDGQIVTAYYQGNSNTRSYQMRVVIWDPVATRNSNASAPSPSP